MKIVDYCESNKQLDRVCVSRISIWSPTNFKEELPAPREALINAGWVKNVGEGA